MIFKPRTFNFYVETKPIQQGTLSVNKRGKLYWVNMKELKPYRESIAESARKEIERHNISDEEMENIMQSAASVYVLFSYKKKITDPIRDKLHTSVPDLDKLIRSVLDALTGVLYNDDKQVVSVHAGKEYDSRDRVDITVTHHIEGE